MENMYRVKYRNGDLEIEVESTDRDYVDNKVEELLSKNTMQLPAKKIPPAKKRTGSTKSPNSQSEESKTIDFATIVAAINDDDAQDKIEEQILNKSAMLPKIILCLHFAQETAGEPLTSGDIQTITDQLGIKVSSANAGTAMKKNQKYFTANTVRKKGAIIKYKLNRKGVQAYQNILEGKKI